MNERIIYQTPDGGLAVIVPAPDCGLTVQEIAFKDVPPGVLYSIVDASEIPTDRTFRNAWQDQGGKVGHDIAKAKGLAHDIRRAKREVDFKPFDEIISKQIPGKAASEAEASRQVIRDKYAVMQTAIDAASNVETLKTALAG